MAAILPTKEDFLTTGIEFGEFSLCQNVYNTYKHCCVQLKGCGHQCCHPCIVKWLEMGNSCPKCQKELFQQPEPAVTPPVAYTSHVSASTVPVLSHPPTVVSKLRKSQVYPVRVQAAVASTHNTGLSATSSLCSDGNSIAPLVRSPWDPYIWHLRYAFRPNASSPYSEFIARDILFEEMRFYSNCRIPWKVQISDVDRASLDAHSRIVAAIEKIDLSRLISNMDVNLNHGLLLPGDLSDDRIRGFIGALNTLARSILTLAVERFDVGYVDRHLHVSIVMQEQTVAARVLLEPETWEAEVWNIRKLSAELIAAIHLLLGVGQ